MDEFDRAGYGTGEIGWGTTAAVLAVDFQAAFVSDDYPTGGSPHVAAAIETAAKVLDAARSAGALVVHTNVEWAGVAEFGRWKVPSLIEITPGSPAASIDPRVWDERDLRIVKRFPSAFFGTDLSSILRQHGVDTLLLTGVTTSGCVRASAVDSFSHGLRTIVVHDATGDQNQAAHASNLTDLERRYADVIDADTAIATFARLADPTLGEDTPA